MQKDYSKIKLLMLTIGIILIITGIIFLIIGFTSFPGEEDKPNVIKDSHEEFSEKMDRESEKNQRAISMIAIGGFTLIPGLALIYISQFRKVASYVATEASPAIETGSHAFGKGMGTGLKESGITSQQSKEVIKIKCPHCGYLESEDAEFCSKCGKKI
jgi:hypothetical protein